MDEPSSPTPARPQTPVDCSWSNIVMTPDPAYPTGTGGASIQQTYRVSSYDLPRSTPPPVTPTFPGTLEPTSSRFANSSGPVLGEFNLAPHPDAFEGFSEAFDRVAQRYSGDSYAPPALEAPAQPANDAIQYSAQTPDDVPSTQMSSVTTQGQMSTIASQVSAPITSVRTQNTPRQIPRRRRLLIWLFGSREVTGVTETTDNDEKKPKSLLWKVWGSLRGKK